jgi:hypothetical protein
MQPRQIARQTSFGPNELKVVFRAYDDAWREIAPKISTDPVALEWARMSLATIVLGLANADTVTPDGLRAMAVAVFCAKHRIDTGVVHGRAQCPHLRLAASRSSVRCASVM